MLERVLKAIYQHHRCPQLPTKAVAAPGFDIKGSLNKLTTGGGGGGV